MLRRAGSARQRPLPRPEWRVSSPYPPAVARPLLKAACMLRPHLASPEEATCAPGAYDWNARGCAAPAGAAAPTRTSADAATAAAVSLRAAGTFRRATTMRFSSALAEPRWIG